MNALRAINGSLRVARDFATFYRRGGTALARQKGVTVGNNCRIYTHHFGSEPFLITIGDRVSIAAGVQLITHDGSTWLVRDQGSRYRRYAPITIRDDVFIGTNAIILPGVSIGSRVVVGAGSVVTQDIPNGVVVAGNPATVIGDFKSFEARIRKTCVNDNELEAVTDYRRWVHHAITKAKRKSQAA